MKSISAWYLWTLAGLALLVTATTAYAVYAGERVTFGDIFDRVGDDIHGRNAWAIARASWVLGGGGFVIASILQIIFKPRRR